MKLSEKIRQLEGSQKQIFSLKDMLARYMYDAQCMYLYSEASLKWTPQIKDTSLNRTHLPSPSTVLAYISTSEIGTPL